MTIALHRAALWVSLAFLALVVASCDFAPAYDGFAPAFKPAYEVLQ